MYGASTGSFVFYDYDYDWRSKEYYEYNSRCYRTGTENYILGGGLNKFQYKDENNCSIFKRDKFMLIECNEQGFRRKGAVCSIDWISCGEAPQSAVCSVPQGYLRYCDNKKYGECSGYFCKINVKVYCDEWKQQGLITDKSYGDWGFNYEITRLGKQIYKNKFYDKWTTIHNYFNNGVLVTDTQDNDLSVYIGQKDKVGDSTIFYFRLKPNIDESDFNYTIKNMPTKTLINQNISFDLYYDNEWSLGDVVVNVKIKYTKVSLGFGVKTFETEQQVVIKKDSEGFIPIKMVNDNEEGSMNAAISIELYKSISDLKLSNNIMMNSLACKDMPSGKDIKSLSCPSGLYVLGTKDLGSFQYKIERPESSQPFSEFSLWELLSDKVNNIWNKFILFIKKTI